MGEVNNTNRAANRILLFVIGLIILAIGAALITVTVWPAAVDVWTGAGEAGQSWLEQAASATAMGAAAVSGLALGVLALIILLIVMLIVAVVRSVAGRRSKTVLRSSGSENPIGRVTVNESFASDAITHSLSGREDILVTHVTANDIRRQPVMHVSVTPRQNTSPREVVADIDHLVTNLATLTGSDVPTYISIHSGLRAKLAHDQRRLA
ncbi:hypothetical protein [Microbacterium sp. P02]|uniref:hypothetical protein n=1 Tax=Microbacterium sp. P02 TaxID=3366260 RepID=UPI00366BF95D